MKVHLEHKRAMGQDGIWSLLDRAEVGQLATVGKDGKPYAVPVCYVFEGERIYFHCGLDGKKLDNIKANPSVCFSVYEVLGQGVDADKPCDSWTHYRSVLATGTAHIIEDRDEKMRSLRILSEKLAKGPVGEIEAGSLDRTCVVEILIEEISGKKIEKELIPEALDGRRYAAASSHEPRG